jgi:hypothetical protein
LLSRRTTSARAKQFSDCVDGHHVTAFGDVPQQLVDVANTH